MGACAPQISSWILGALSHTMPEPVCQLSDRGRSLAFGRLGQGKAFYRRRIQTRQTARRADDKQQSLSQTVVSELDQIKLKGKKILENQGKELP
jgi:hypothetical protein